MQRLREKRNCFQSNEQLKFQIRNMCYNLVVRTCVFKALLAELSHLNVVDAKKESWHILATMK